MLEVVAGALEPAARAVRGRAVVRTLVPPILPVFIIAIGTVVVPGRLVTTETIGLAITRLVSGEAVIIVVLAGTTVLTAGRDTTVVSIVVVLVF